MVISHEISWDLKILDVCLNNQTDSVISVETWIEMDRKRKKKKQFKIKKQNKTKEDHFDTSALKSAYDLGPWEKMLFSVMD